MQVLAVGVVVAHAEEAGVGHAGVEDHVAEVASLGMCVFIFILKLSIVIAVVPFISSGIYDLSSTTTVFNFLRRVIFLKFSFRVK